METIILIQYVLVPALIIYAFAFFILWMFELRKNVLYDQMQKQLKFLESLNLSSALCFAKTYKIKEDFRKGIMALEKGQKIILENMMFGIKQGDSEKKPFHV